MISYKPSCLNCLVDMFPTELLVIPSKENKKKETLIFIFYINF